MHCATNPALVGRLARSLRAGLFVLGLLLSATPLHAQAPAPNQQAGEQSDEAAIAPAATEPVILDSVTLFRVRGSASFPAAARAAAVGARIEEIARDSRIAVDTIKVEERPLGSAIVAGDKVLAYVVDADARVEGIERKVLASLYADTISRAIARYRSEREPQALAVSAAYATAAVAMLAIVLFGLWRLYRRVDLRLALRYRARLDDLRIKGFKVFQAEQLAAAIRRAVGAVHVLAAIVCVYLALQFALSQFPVTRGAAAGLLDLLISPLATMGSGLVAAIPDLVFLAILALVTRYVLKTMRLFFGAVEYGSVKISGFDADWATPTYRIFRLLVIAFALVVAYPYIPGSHSDAFKGISLFIGVIFSLGSSSFVANIIAGYAMTYRRAFRVGDRIGVGDVFGDVTQIRLQVTHLRTPKNEEIVIPNSTLLNSHVTNYSTLAKSNGLILHTTVGIGYETPWRQVEAMLLMAAERTPDVLREPAPFVLQKSLGDFAVTYELNAYCDRPAEMNRIYTELHRNILDMFNEYGVAIMTPAYEGDTEQPKVVPKARWYAAPARAPGESAAAGSKTAG
jgi:small-conductance mechanosensitive channel